MSGSSYSIHWEEEDFTPKLIPPENPSSLSISKEREQVLTTLVQSESLNRSHLPLSARIKEIPRRCFSFFKDAQWMSLAEDLFAIGSKSCYLAGHASANVVPFLSVITFPFFLYHSLEAAGRRFKLMICACKISRVAEAIFWGGRAIGAAGLSLTKCIKPFTTCVSALGLTQIPAVGMTFSLILPIIIIVFSVIGGSSNVWSLFRASDSLQRFKQKKGELDGSLESLEEMLHYLQGPIQIDTNHEKFKLETARFKETHFTNDRRKEAIQKRLEVLFSHHDVHDLRSLQEQFLSNEVKGVVEPLLTKLKTNPDHHMQLEMQNLLKLLEDTSMLFESLLDQERSSFQKIDTIISLYDQLLIGFKDSKYQEIWAESHGAIDQLIQQMEKNRKEIYNMKQNLYNEGVGIIQTSHSEMHRVLTIHSATILLSALILASAVLVLLPSSFKLAATGVSLASSGFCILTILFDKAISQKQFQELERFLHTLEARSVPHN